MGGSKHHTIVLPDAQPHQTASEIVKSHSICAGQRCLSPSVILSVGESDNVINEVAKLADEVFVEQDIGPLINSSSKNRILRYISQAEESGVNILVDGRKKGQKLKGHYLGITILDNVKPDSKVAVEEIFGPVLSIIRVNNIKDSK